MLSVSLIVCLGIFALGANSSSARFEVMFEEMLGGAPLPGMTQLVLSNRMTLTVVFTLVALGGVSGVLFLKKTGPVLLVSVFASLFLFLGAFVVLLGCYLPLVSVITHLNSASVAVFQSTTVC